MNSTFMKTKTTTSGQTAKLFTMDDPLEDIPNDATLEALKKTFDKSVTNKVRSTEDQIKDAANRLQMRLLDLELVVSLAENRVALSLDPRYLEQAQRLKQLTQEFDEMVGKHGVHSSTL
jgi:hypothetical protein